MKTCTDCGQTKTLNEFGVARENRDGLRHHCKACAAIRRKAHYAANRNKERAQNDAYVAANREKVLTKKAAAQRAWNEANIVIKRARDAAYDKAQRAAKNPRFMANAIARQAKRRAAIVSATPRWADMDLICDIYTLAAVYRAAGYDCHVDHIVPLAGKKVCGLHTHDNLTVVPPHVNQSKSNKFEVGA